MILPRRPELIFGASGVTRPIRALHSGYIDWAGGRERAPSVRICRFLARIAAGVAALMIGQAAYADLLIKIDKSAQRMIVTLDGEQLYQWRVATGAVGYDTPSGAFKPFRMEVVHYSEEWDNAPMPYSIFFTQTGNAIYGTYEQRSLGHPVSHGCVRLSVKNAATLWSLVKREKMRSSSSSPSRGLARATSQWTSRLISCSSFATWSPTGRRSRTVRNAKSSSTPVLSHCLSGQPASPVQRPRQRDRRRHPCGASGRRGRRALRGRRRGRNRGPWRGRADRRPRH